MKKIAIVLAVLISCGGFLTSDAINWRFVGKNSSGERWYIDDGSMLKDDSRALVWLKWEQEDGYWILRREVTKDRTIKLLQYVIYDLNGNIVYLHKAEPGEYKTYSIPPNTILEDIYNAIW